MHSHPPRRQTKLGAVRNRRPTRLAANDNQDWSQSTGCTGPDEWELLGDVLSRASKRWWLDE